MNNLLSPSIINPYLTTIGKIFNKPVFENKLQTFLSNIGSHDLSFGIKLKNHKPILLTGFLKMEEDIPFFQYPIIFTSARGEKYIAIDLREYVNNVRLKAYSRDQDVFSLFTRYDNVNFLLCVMGIMDLSTDGDLEWLPKDIVIEAYSYLFNFLLKGVVTLPYVNIVDIQYLTMLYYFTILKGSRIDDISSDRVRAYMEKMSKKWNLSKKDHDILISGFIQEQVNMGDNEYCTMNNYLQIISSTLSPDKKPLFSTSVIGNVLKNIWVGHGRQNTALMCFENIAIFIGMLYTSNKHSTLKDSRITKIMKDSKIDLKKLNQVIESSFKFIQK